MEPEGSLPHSQVPANRPYPEPARSSLYPHIPLPEDPSECYPPIYAWVSLVVSLYTSGFPTKILNKPFPSPVRATCPARIILLDFITRTIFGKVYRSLSSSLYSFLHSPLTSSLLGPKILLNTLFSNTLSLCSSLIVRDQTFSLTLCVKDKVLPKLAHLYNLE